MLLTIFHTPQENIPQLGFCKSSPSKKRVIVIMQEEGQHSAMGGEWRVRVEGKEAESRCGLRWTRVALAGTVVLVLRVG